MPALDWQLAIALVCVAAAALVLACRAWSLVAKKSGGGCGSGGCGTCPANPVSPGESQTRPFVAVETLSIPGKASSSRPPSPFR